METASSGQNGLLPLLSSQQSKPGNSISSYPLASSFEVDRNMIQESSSHGLEVLKVSKNGKLHPRRLAFSRDHRSLLVTSNRCRSMKDYIKLALQTNQTVAARMIDIGSIEFILRDQQSKRFFLARSQALTNESDAIMRLMLESEAASVTLVYRATPFSSDLEESSNNQSGTSGGSTNSSSSSKQTSNRHTYETLDMIFPSQEVFGFFITALEDLVRLHREEQRRLAPSLRLLQYYWLDSGKDLLRGTLSGAEWLSLCGRIGVGLKRSELTNLFKSYEKQLKEGEGMSFSYVGEIFGDVEEQTSEQDPLEKIWRNLVKTDPIPALVSDNADDDASLELTVQDESDEETISAVAFLSFIRAQQKEYNTSLEEVILLVQALNNQITYQNFDEYYEGNPIDAEKDHRIQIERNQKPLASADRLAKSRFMSFIASDANDLLNPTMAKVGADDMSKPLSHYWINTSHDTYLAMSSQADTSTDTVNEQMYLHALQRGVRCLELDLWDSTTGEPVIARKQPTSADKDRSIALSVVLRIVRSFVQFHPDCYPVILRLENHCTFEVQKKVAQQIYHILGLAKVLAMPDMGDNVDVHSPLPSPRALRGKVMLMGKRPSLVSEGSKIMNDDFDDENDVVDEDLLETPSMDKDEIDEDLKHIIGFSSSNVLGTTSFESEADRHQSPETLVETVTKSAERSKLDAEECEARAAKLAHEAEEAENIAAKLTQDAGLTAAEVKARAMAASPKSEEAPNDQGVEVQYGVGLATSPRDEGLEVQEFLHEEVKGSRVRYSSVIADAISASERATTCLKNLNEADYRLKESEAKLHQLRQKEKESRDSARRAASEARSNREYAESAKRRVDIVKELLRKCEESASSAATVVVTASTEAKISERRASETEARYQRAQTIADRERARADEETKKEEHLEQEAARYHAERAAATNASQAARGRIESAGATLENVIEEIRTIEASEEFKNEKRKYPDYPNSKAAQKLSGGDSALARHMAKREEKEICKSIIKEASNENTQAEAKYRESQKRFEEKAHLWKIQADIAAQARKQSDRTSMVAEELAEHAEEEREAATLRDIARQKAEASVQQRNFHLESVKAQLAEAERAAIEAEGFAVDSGKAADVLAQKAESDPELETMIRTTKNHRFLRDQAKNDFEEAKGKKERADKIASDTKRLLETNAEVYSIAVRDAAAETTRVHSEQLSERKAVIAYNRALLVRKQADHVKALSNISQAKAKEKELAVKRAKEYKDKRDKVVPIPTSLARMTLLHSTKHRYWQRSLNMPSFHVLSMPQKSMSFLYNQDPITHRKKFVSFTRAHLCRGFPTRNPKDKKSSTESNYNEDPVLSWSLGCQMVAVNLNTPDENFLLVDGRFRQNGQSGYVLKPRYLTENTTRLEKEQRWRITVIRGNYIPKPESKGGQNTKTSTQIVNPFVKITVCDCGSSSDTTTPGEADTGTTRMEHVTEAVKSNGLNPVWDDKQNIFNFRVARASVAMIVFSVWDYKMSGEQQTNSGSKSAEVIGAAAIPVSCMRQGYRSVALFDIFHTRTGPYSVASLLVKSEKISS